MDFQPVHLYRNYSFKNLAIVSHNVITLLVIYNSICTHVVLFYLLMIPICDCLFPTAAEILLTGCCG